MAMASLNASLLAPKGCAQPAVSPPTLVSDTQARYAAIGQIAPTSKPPKKPVDNRKAPEKNTKKKSLRLSASMDKDLRLLAVRNGMSQQALLEMAVSDYLDRAFAAEDCICRR